MKTRTVVTAAMIATVLSAQSVRASQNAPLTEDAVAPVTAATPRATITANGEVTGSSETYAELLQRIKADSLRQLGDKLDTDKLVSEAISSTLRSLMDATLNGKPHI